MARNNTLNATFTMASGDGASGFQETLSTANFTSGDALKIEGSVVNVEVTYTLADYGLVQGDGVYLENRSSLHEITLKLTNGASEFVTIDVAPSGVFMVRMDPDMSALVSVKLTGDAAGCDFVLCVAE